jgi:hypothetical protein
VKSSATRILSVADADFRLNVGPSAKPKLDSRGATPQTHLLRAHERTEGDLYGQASALRDMGNMLEHDVGALHGKVTRLLQTEVCVASCWPRTYCTEMRSFGLKLADPKYLFFPFCSCVDEILFCR